VFDAIVTLLDEQAAKQKQDDMKARLKAKVR
jgi:hypothetical protein